MSNSSVLSNGRKKVASLVTNHILNTIMIPFADRMRREAENMRIGIGHNMTGNTVNSYGAAVYHNGKMVWDSYSTTKRPLRRKLSGGERFYARNIRWDGDIQEHTFTAEVATNGSTEAERSIAFLRSYQATTKGFEAVICNGVEYASFQEHAMKIDVLTSSFDYARMFYTQYFKPIS